ncbi:MAG: non-heme iron oxygenase ferredoxin subunit [Proteobacteria bacterium]|nr:non-heme iron oxygenase ferredoxin subunit [Pseudomonadota bacterium]
MSAWTDIGAAADLADSARLLAEIDGYYLQCVQVGGDLYAFEDRCTHDDAPLDDAEIEGREIICPRHGSRFCLRTGAALTPPAYEPLRIFEVRQHGDRIEVRAP